LWNDADEKYTTEDMTWAKLLLKRDSGLISVMRKAGVGLLAGTDLPPNTKDGTIHDELAALVSAGLTPIEALETATSNPATFLGRLDTSGTIEAGKEADLVLLDADPLADIHNTSRLSAVILRGRLLPRFEPN
ncbi:MAG: amidohydrolase family protein, partial [Blastocatellia bacterium]